MGKFYTELNESIREFIGEQKIFFVATAPVKGRISLSPKGMNTFKCINDKNVAYLDLTGRENETAAHLFENSRITIMFCSFSDKPMILRLYGPGRVVRKQDDEWKELFSLFGPFPGVRQIIVLEINSVQTSCGFGVPIYEFKDERKALVRWAEKKGEQGIQEYQKENNHTSIDGLPTKILED